MTEVLPDFEGAALFLPRLPSSPYPGLRPFQKNEWPIFFGRELMTDQVISQLMKDRLLFVHGTSGNGKSSLIRAGVLARLEQEHARSGIRWRTCATNPGRNPLGNLADALAGIDQAGGQALDFRRSLNHGLRSADAISQLLGLGAGNRLCVLIDQFEEIFHDAEAVSTDRATLLSEFLVGFSQAPPEGLYVLVTMRSEFLGLCSRFSGLAEVINRTQYLLPRMDTENLLRAVREPAALFGGSVSARLAERLIIDAKSSQDELPLIQHGLSRLWETAEEDQPRLDIANYESATSLSKMISDHADRVADAVAGDASGKKIIEELFRALTAISPDNHAIRRQQSFSRLAAITGAPTERLHTILNAFRGAGVSFITPYPPVSIEADTIVDVSHEALIRHWRRIADRSAGWLQKEFRDGLIWQALRVQAEIFLSNPKNLLSEATTEARSAWLKERNTAWTFRYGGMWAEVEELIAASQRDIELRRWKEEEQKQRAEKDRVQLERGRRLRYYVAAAAVVITGMSVLTSIAIYSWRQAESAREVSEVQTRNAQAEKLSAEAARRTAEEQWQRAETEKAAAEEARGDAEAARRKAVEEQQRAEAERENAVAARTEAVVARSKAEDEARKAQEEKTRADVARQEVEAALKNLVEERNRSAKFQDEAALSYIQSHGSSRETLARALSALDKELDDPLKIAFYGQIVGQLSMLASATEIQTAIQVLARSLERNRDLSSAVALAQALSGLAANLTVEQAQLEASALLKNSPENISIGQANAIALVFAAIAPKVNSTTAGDMKAFLSRLLGRSKDPELISAIAIALSSLNWVPTALEAETMIDPLLGVVPAVKDPIQLENIATIIATIAPKLSVRTARRALDELQSLPQQGRSLGPAISVLSGLVTPVESSQKSAQSLNLLQRIASSRWCTPSRSYSLQVSGGLAIWRDNLGSIDTETIVTNTPSTAQTVTEKSLHPDGKSEPIGTTWNYQMTSGGDSISINSSSNKSFSLKRC